MAKLPSFLKFKSARDLIRIGRDNDGGYLVSQSDIDKSDVLIGLGINDDWSFERDFIKQNDVEVFAYDASISQKYFFKQFLKSLIIFYKPKIAFHWLKVIWDYLNFFSKPNHHHIKKYVGLNSENNIHCTLSSILDCSKYKNIYLKIDVEGSEYRFLNTLILHQNRISGLVLELHDCDLHLKTIERFIDRFNLRLAHIHANNYAPIRLDDGLPIAMELTFSSGCALEECAILPHRLDMPNNRKEGEITLSFGT